MLVYYYQIFCFCLVFCTAYSSQNESQGESYIVKKYNDGVYDSSFIEYYPNGSIKLKGQFLDGNKVDTFWSYHSNGNIHEINIYRNNLIYDYYVYDENGRKEDTMNLGFRVNTDTVKLGDRFQIDIKINSRTYDNVALVIGNIDEKGIVKDTIKDTIKVLEEVDNGIFSYSFIPKDTGNHQVAGNAISYKNYEGSKTSRVKPFIYNYYVTSAVSDRTPKRLQSETK